MIQFTKRNYIRLIIAAVLAIVAILNAIDFDTEVYRMLTSAILLAFALIFIIFCDTDDDEFDELQLDIKKNFIQ